MTSLKEFRNYLERLSSEKADPVAGFFGPSSLVWKVSRETMPNVGMVRAALMQVAHPKIAQGVADHSDFRNSPLKRAMGTYFVAGDLVFGDRERATKAALRLYAIHGRVNGQIGDTTYRARDQELLLWVYATLVDSTVYLYGQLMADLSPEEWEQCYQESKTLAQLFGIDPNYIPGTLVELRSWVDSMVTSDEITVTPAARAITRGLLTGRWYCYPVSPFVYVMAAGSLPPKLREGFGFRWDATTRISFSILLRALRGIRTFAPSWLITTAAARYAERRIGLQNLAGD